MLSLRQPSRHVIVVAAASLLISFAGGACAQGDKLAGRDPLRAKSTPLGAGDRSERVTKSPAPASPEPGAIQAGADKAGSNEAGGGSDRNRGKGGSTRSAVPASIPGHNIEVLNVGDAPADLGAEVGKVECGVVATPIGGGPQITVICIELEPDSPLRMVGPSMGATKTIAGQKVIVLDEGAESTLIWKRNSDIVVFGYGGTVAQIEAVMAPVIAAQLGASTGG
jgi:hypothetical protein